MINDTFKKINTKYKRKPSSVSSDTYQKDIGMTFTFPCGFVLLDYWISYIKISKHF